MQGILCYQYIFLPFKIVLYDELESSHSVFTVQIINVVPIDESSIYEQDAGHAHIILYNAIYVLCRSWSIKAFKFSLHIESRRFVLILIWLMSLLEC